MYHVDSPSVRDSGVELQSNVESPPQRTEFEVWSESTTPSPRGEEEEEEAAEEKAAEEEEATAAAEDEEALRIEEEAADAGPEDEGPEEDTGRKTPRRVHFGGEVVKLRTPDSDLGGNETFQVNRQDIQANLL